jgi:peptidoglycan/LPS O-acetylase OafA/YrhL
MRKLKNNILHFLEIIGLISYSFYLWHGEILNITKNIFNHSQSSSYKIYFITLIVSFFITILLSLMTYTLIEIKFTNYLKKVISQHNKM